MKNIIFKFIFLPESICLFVKRSKMSSFFIYSHFPLKWLIILVSLPEFRCGFIILVSYHFSEFRVWNPEELKTAPNGVECVFWSSRRKNGSLCELFALQNRMFLFVSFRACCVIAVAMIFPKQTRFYHMSELSFQWV